MAIMGTGQASGDSRARDAIDEAINSPLLEDLDLRGARGVVVNITTAPSVGIREFQEIGNSVRDLASKGATVVIGTVNDESLGEEMRITVVATGLGNTKSETADTSPPRSPIGMPNYRDLDRPTVMRNNATAEEATTRTTPSDPDFLDIPAFLRRQAD